jgi:hypothetical protein
MHQVCIFNEKRDKFDPVHDAVQPLKQLAGSISTAAVRFFTHMPPERTMSVRSASFMCKVFSSFSVRLNLRAGLLRVVRPRTAPLVSEEQEIVELEIKPIWNEANPIYEGAYLISRVDGRGSGDIDPLPSANDLGLIAYNRLIVLQRVDHPEDQMYIYGAKESQISEHGSSRAVVEMHPSKITILTCVCSTGQTIHIDSGYESLNQAVLQEIQRCPLTAHCPTVGPARRRRPVTAFLRI